MLSYLVMNDEGRLVNGSLDPCVMVEDRPPQFSFRSGETEVRDLVEKLGVVKPKIRELWIVQCDSSTTHFFICPNRIKLGSSGNEGGVAWCGYLGPSSGSVDRIMLKHLYHLLSEFQTRMNEIVCKNQNH